MQDQSEHAKQGTKMLAKQHTKSLEREGTLIEVLSRAQTLQDVQMWSEQAIDEAMETMSAGTSGCGRQLCCHL